MSKLINSNNAWVSELPDGWQYFVLDDLVLNYVDNRGKTVPTVDKGIPLIATNCIKNENLFPVYEKVRYISQDIYDTWFRGHPEPEDIIIVNKGTPGLTNLVPNPVDFVIAQDMMALRANTNIVTPKYLFSALRNPNFLAQVAGLTVGTTIPHLKKGDFDKLIIPVPPPKVQEYIGEIFYTLSYKIEANRRMNETLENTARAIFKSWFVDFDPVHAKANGDIPEGMSAETADLFPDDFQESELGLIPRGWELQPLIDTADYINGAAYKNIDFDLNQDGLPVIKIAELKNGVSGNTKFTQKTLKDKYFIADGEVLFSWSGNPETSIDTFIWTGGDAWLNQHIFRVVTRSKQEKYFVYFLLKYLKPEFTRIASNKQTTGLGHVTKSDMKRMKVILPHQDILDLFSDIGGGIWCKIYENELQTRTLTELRDTLLPRLISGELRVEDVSEFVGDV